MTAMQAPQPPAYSLKRWDVVRLHGVPIQVGELGVHMPVFGPAGLAWLVRALDGDGKALVAAVYPPPGEAAAVVVRDGRNWLPVSPEVLAECKPLWSAP